MRYSERVICFIDILGFKKRIEESPSVDSIQEVLDLPKRIFEKPQLRGIRKHITLFSDSVIISFDKTVNHEVYETISSILQLVVHWVEYGVLCRGAITIGELVHNVRDIYGPGFIRAYELEKVAKYPRIIVDESVLALARDYPIEKHSGETEVAFVKALLRKDTSDGKYFINYLDSFFNDGERRIIDNGYYKNLRKIIVENIDSDRSDVREKYVWLKEQYNSVISRLIANRDGKNPFLSGLSISEIEEI